MAHTTEERQQVYRMCRALFSGDSAQLRQRKRVRKVLVNNKESLQPLFQGMGEEKLVRIVQFLLENRVFESELRATVMFPELFRTSPQRDAQREASEANAARSAANALVDITQSEDDDHVVDPAIGSTEGDGRPVKPNTNDEASTTTPFLLHPDVPSLYPSYLPYSTQHAILTNTQKVLEECCFEFASRWIPDVVQQKGWDCASAVELTKWAKTFDKQMTKLPSDAIATTSSSITDVLYPTHELRHTAVHRLPTPARRISQMLRAALKLAEALQDLTRAAQLEELVSEVDAKIKAMELTKNALEDRALSQLEGIRRQREELDRQEKGLTEEMVKDDHDNKMLIGRLLEASVKEIFEGTKSHTLEEEETDGAEFDEGFRVKKLNGVKNTLNEAPASADDVSQGQLVIEQFY
ncbi:ubiquinol-cytochrome-c reductase cytochrome c1, partial [Colletotrichum incanum]